jgi:DNA-binding CsgD family transcriptional regulator
VHDVQLLSHAPQTVSAVVVHAETVYWSAPHAERRAVHRRLAAVLPDLEERARHTALAASGPDPESASLVEAAAEHARLRGAPSVAAELLELSCELTPVDDEDERCHRTRLAALNLFDAGDVRRAHTKLETLIAATSSRRQRAKTTMELAVRSYNDVDRVQALLRDALPDLEGEFAAIAHANLAWVAITKLDPSSAAHHAHTAITLADEHGPIGLRIALGALAHAEALHGLDPEPTTRRAAAIGADIAPGEAGHPAGIRAQHLLWAGRIEEALRLSRECDRAYAEAGLELMRHDSLPVLTEVECAAGDWSAASVHADEGYDIVVHAGLDEMLDQMLYPRAHVAALTGDLENARIDATAGVARAAAQGDLWAEVANRSVLGFVALSEDDPGGAVQVLSPAERHMAGGTIAEPGALPFIPDLVEGLVSIGQLDRARALTDRLWELGAGLDRPLAMATASRCRALIAAASGDPTGALEETEHALAEHDRISIPFERARTLLVQGETLRRMKRKRPAREALEAARDDFYQLGARSWLARAERGLGRIGGRAASPTELTATEQRVAEVVALGLTNKEAAARLFLSVHTVESSLSRIYRKLGIRSRSELARQLPPVHRPGSDDAAVR